MAMLAAENRHLEESLSKYCPLRASGVVMSDVGFRMLAILESSSFVGSLQGS
jgi:hypothetical protein